MMDNEVLTKKWYHSKCLWINTVAIIAIIIQGVTGKELINAEIQAGILGLINLILRLITKQGISK